MPKVLEGCRLNAELFLAPPLEGRKFKILIRIFPFKDRPDPLRVWRCVEIVCLEEKHEVDVTGDICWFVYVMATRLLDPFVNSICYALLPYACTLIRVGPGHDFLKTIEKIIFPDGIVEGIPLGLADHQHGIWFYSLFVCSLLASVRDPSCAEGCLSSSSGVSSRVHQIRWIQACAIFSTDGGFS
jgi:hypothetical protein